MGRSGEPDDTVDAVDEAEEDELADRGKSRW